MLILGGGFAGAYVARLLGSRGATIVSHENFMLYTPLLPEAASGTLEPRHTVVPLRVMCPQAELLLGDLTAVDLEARTATVETDAGPQTRALARARARARRGAAHRSRFPGLREHGALVQVAAGRDQPSQPRAARARGGRRGAGRRSAPRAALVRLRRRGLRRRRGARRALRPRRRRDALLPAAARRAAAVGARRRRAEDPAGDPAAARRVRRARARGARRRDPRRHDARVGDAPTRPCSATARASRRTRSSGRRACARTRCCASSASRSTIAAASRSTSSCASAACPSVWALGDCARVPNTRSDDARSADVPARAPPGAPAREEPRAATRSRTATGCSARSRRSAATRGSPTSLGLRFRGFLGWFVTRSYHLYQLPLAQRRSRVVVDWTSSLLFRRDLAELGMLGQTEDLG